MLFGGDASKQRAELYAAEKPEAYRVVLRLIDQIDPRKFGLDIHARDSDGIVYDYVAHEIDFSECTDDEQCTADRGPYGMAYAHTHCAIDGCPLMAEGGGGDDGMGIGGYTDAMMDPVLKELVHIKCFERIHGNKPCLRRFSTYTHGGERVYMSEHEASLVFGGDCSCHEEPAE